MLLENYNWERPVLQNQVDNVEQIRCSDVRPEGPAFNGHDREGVDQELPKGERRRCGTQKRHEVSDRRASKSITAISTPSRAWLFDTSPSGLSNS